MKLSSVLPFALLVWGASATVRKLDQQVTDLSNGAVLAVDMAYPPAGGSIGFRLTAPATTTDIDIRGTASIGKGKPDVSYLYIIDSSGSTGGYDPPCTNELECIQTFFMQLHEQAYTDGSAKLAAVIDFDDNATVTANWNDPNNTSLFNQAFNKSVPEGGTNCTAALELATELVNHPDNTANTTVVVFASDGQCNDEREPNITETAAALGKTGAIVHTMAIGTTIDCNDYNDLDKIPQNGGTCHSVPQPENLPNFIDDLIGTNLTKLEVKVDNGNYMDIEDSEISGGSLPMEGAAGLNFATRVKNLAAGPHDLCVRASGEDSLGGKARIEDCHSVTVKAPAPAPGKDSSNKTFSSGETALIVLVALVGFVVCGLVVQKALRYTNAGGEEQTGNNLEMRDTSEAEEQTGSDLELSETENSNTQIV